MDKPTKESYSNRFKAKVALEACSGKNVQELSEKYAVATAMIKAWKHELNDRAELLFISRDQTPEILQTHAALLKTIIESSPNGIIVTDLNREVIIYNKKSVEMWALPQHIEKKESLKRVMPYILKKIKEPNKYQQIVENSYRNLDKHSNNIIELKDGRFFERTTVPYQVDDEIIGQVINFADITRFKETEGKLTEFSNLLQSINTNVNEGILRSTPDSGLVYVNEAFVRMFGYDTKEEAMATAPSAFYADP